MTRTSADIPAPPLSVTRGAALYIGALLGPGLLLLPGLAAAQAGPASMLAWAAGRAQWRAGASWPAWSAALRSCA